MYPISYNNEIHSNLLDICYAFLHRTYVRTYVNAHTVGFVALVKAEGGGRGGLTKTNTYGIATPQTPQHTVPACPTPSRQTTDSSSAHRDRDTRQKPEAGTLESGQAACLVLFLSFGGK